MSSKSARFVPSIRLSHYDVVNKKGDNLGEVQTFVVDMKEGLIAFALVAFGGFLGITDKWFALPWGALKWHPETKKFILDMPEDVLKNAPGMHKDKWLEDIDKWQKEEDLAVIDRFYNQYGYESYEGIVRLVSIKRGRRKPEAKFEINKDVAGEFRFKLVALNGQTIAVSEGYTAKDGAMQGIESVRNNAAVALIEDKTV
jgi:uncharacterized protein YegP (UPF0339 family)